MYKDDPNCNGYHAHCKQCNACLIQTPIPIGCPSCRAKVSRCGINWSTRYKNMRDRVIDDIHKEEDKRCGLTDEMFGPETPKLKWTIWQRIKILFGWKPYIVPEFKTIILPIIKADWPNLNANVFTEQSLKKNFPESENKN